VNLLQATYDLEELKASYEGTVLSQKDCPFEWEKEEG